ncbi:MAG: hypothetical protein K8R21_00100, partial [Leptospira sp.]|nr:hypothetical protein [Leptospira sp.]
MIIKTIAIFIFTAAILVIVLYFTFFSYPNNRSLVLLQHKPNKSESCNVKVDQVFITTKACIDPLLPVKYCSNRILIYGSYDPNRSDCIPNSYTFTVKSRPTSAFEQKIAIEQGYASYYSPNRKNVYYFTLLWSKSIPYNKKDLGSNPFEFFIDH